MCRPFKVFGFLTKKQDIDAEAFVDHCENQHVPLICGLAPLPIVYKHSYLVREDEINREDSGINFDVVTELVFPDSDAYLTWP